MLEGRPTVKNLSLEVQELIKETYGTHTHSISYASHQALFVACLLYLLLRRYTCDFVLYDAVVQQMRGELLAHFKTEKALQSAVTYAQLSCVTWKGNSGTKLGVAG